MSTKFNEHFPVLREKDHNIRLIEHYLQYQPKEYTNYVKEFDFHYPDLTDEEMILLIYMLVDARDGYSQHIPDVGKTLQKLLVALRTNVELIKQQTSKVPPLLKREIRETTN